MNDYLLDACALLAFLRQEIGWEIIKDLLCKAVRKEVKLYMNIVNLVEVFYYRIRESGFKNIEYVFNEVYDLPISFIKYFDKDEIGEAAALKAAGGLSLADAFLIATAKLTGATLVTSDHDELEPVESKGEIQFLWFRPRRQT